MALGTITLADGSVTTFDYQSTQSTFQANNSLTINGPNIIIEFAVGAENVDLEAEYINYLNRASRNPGAALNSFMSQRIVSVTAISNLFGSLYGFTFEAAATLEDACAASPSANGLGTGSTLVIGSTLFQSLTVEGIPIRDPLNPGTYALSAFSSKYFVTVVEGGYVSAFEICPLTLTYEGIVGVVYVGGTSGGCAPANNTTFGLITPTPGDIFPPDFPQLFILDGGSYRAATDPDILNNLYVGIEFNTQTGTPTPGQRWVIRAYSDGGAIYLQSFPNLGC